MPRAMTIPATSFNSVNMVCPDCTAAAPLPHPLRNYQERLLSPLPIRKDSEALWAFTLTLLFSWPLRDSS